MRRLGRRSQKLGLYTCLSLGLMDLVVLNVFFAPGLGTEAVATKALKAVAVAREAPAKTATQKTVRAAATPRATGREDVAPTRAGALISELPFATGQYRLNAQVRRTLAKVARQLSARSEAKVELIGHCDRRGSARLNLRLSQQRAEAVKQALITLGIDARRLRTRGVGASQPVVSEDGEDAWAKNRRVEIRWR